MAPRSLAELTSDIVAAHATSNPMTGTELLDEMKRVHALLKELSDETEATATPSAAVAPVVSIKDAFKKDTVTCLECGASFTTLSRHLTQTHKMSVKDYRKKHNIPASQPLTSKTFSGMRRKMAEERGGERLAQARLVRAEKVATRHSERKSA